MISNFIFFAIAGMILIFSGIYLVKSLTKIARMLGISEFSIAFILMAFATSIPEIFIGVGSAISNTQSLSLGNIIGANILDLTLISGIFIIIGKEIKFKTKKINNDTYIMLISIVLVIVLFFIGNQLSRMDGIILLTFFFFHIHRVFKKRKKYPKKTKNILEEKDKLKHIMIFLISLMGLFLSSHFVVKYASLIAEDLQITNLLVGLFLLSFTTTLPELIFGISAIKMKHKVMAFGDQIGTIITNSTLILGVVSLINPIQGDVGSMILSSLFLILSAFIFTTFVKTGRKLEKMEGISLIFLYILFMVTQILLKNN